MPVCFSSHDPSHSPVVKKGYRVVVVPHAKLLGVVIQNNLNWNLRVDTMYKKAAKRLFALRLLKRSGMPDEAAVAVYRTNVRLILEYTCEVWHYCFPQYLSDEI